MPTVPKPTVVYVPMPSDAAELTNAPSLEDFESGQPPSPTIVYHAMPTVPKPTVVYVPRPSDAAELTNAPSLEDFESGQPPSPTIIYHAMPTVPKPTVAVPTSVAENSPSTTSSNEGWPQLPHGTPSNSSESVLDPDPIVPLDPPTQSPSASNDMTSQNPAITPHTPNTPTTLDGDSSVSSPTTEEENSVQPIFVTETSPPISITLNTSMPVDFPVMAPAQPMLSPSVMVPSIPPVISPSRPLVPPAIASRTPPPTSMEVSTMQPFSAPSAKTPIADHSPTSSPMIDSPDTPAAIVTNSPTSVWENANITQSSDYPSYLPSLLPSFTPTVDLACEDMSSKVREARIFRHLVSLSGSAPFDDPDHPLTSASSWIISQDPLQLCPGDANLSQRYALVVLYFFTNGDAWKRCRRDGSVSCSGNNFLSGYHECSWGGITCDAQRNILRINLDENNMRGTIPSELQNLEYLMELDLDSNSLIGHFPDWVGHMRHLEMLDLDKNILSGPLPDSLYESTSLEFIDIDRNILSGYISTKIGQMKQLIFFQVDFNQFIGTIPSELGSIPSLKYLSVFGNGFDESLGIPAEICELEDIKIYSNCEMCTKVGDCCDVCLPDPEPF
jgi:hypothetical protein